ncbi:hypothetical protein IWQ62_005615 [Dispira parvispora]|uniref:Transmembrane protein 199 n=1 Tax=Dispira parvispora TaxID=1520584 RepID=A0A9W8APL4_9FUNG|nr:hypothetical protein IWQ62_005615 [Dispira parvispora]
MVKLVVTDAMRVVLRQAQAQPNCPDPLRQNLQAFSDSKAAQDCEAVEFTLLQQVVEFLSRGQSCSPPSLSQILTGTAVHFPRPEKKPRNPQLEEHLENIRTQLAQKDYMRMVKQVSLNEKYRVGSHSLRDIAQVNQNLMVIVNILFSIAAVFATVFYTSTTLTSDFAVRVLLGMCASITVGGAEVWLYVSKMNKTKTADVKTSAYELVN